MIGHNTTLYHFCSLAQQMSNPFNLIIVLSAFNFYWLTQNEDMAFCIPSCKKDLILFYSILYLNQACFGLHVFTFLLSVWFTYCQFFFTKFSQIIIEKFHSIYPCARTIFYVILKTKYVCYFSIISPPIFNNNSML